MKLYEKLMNYTKSLGIMVDCLDTLGGTVMTNEFEYGFTDGHIALAKRLMEFHDTIDRITAERDEARRDICSMMHMTGFLAGDYADSKGWDCFKDGYTGFSTEIQNFRDIFYGYKDELRAERDQARRELIAYDAIHGKLSVAAAAKARGWGYLIKENKSV
jgi:hypothetical protein